MQYVWEPKTSTAKRVENKNLFSFEKCWAFMKSGTVKEPAKWKQERQLVKYLVSQASLSVHSSNYFSESKHTALHRNTELKV